MKLKTFVLLIMIYLISFLVLKTNVNLFYPYYFLKDIFFFPVQAIESEIVEDARYKEGIEQELRKEIEELKQLNDLSSTLTDFEKVSATVIERNRMYWFNTITINKGRKSGIKEDMAVVSKSGLIGRIYKVSSTTSEIKLITTSDVNHKISVRIESDAETIYGIMSGYNEKDNALQVTSVNKDMDDLENSLVYTSGMGGIFPSGILIGKVKGIKKDKYDVSKVIEVEPTTNFNDVRFVNVLIRK